MTSFEVHKAKWADQVRQLIPWETDKFRSSVLESVLAQLSAGVPKEYVLAEFETIKSMYAAAESFYNLHTPKPQREIENSRAPFSEQEIQEALLVNNDFAKDTIKVANSYIEQDLQVTRKIAFLRVMFMIIKVHAKEILGPAGVELDKLSSQFADKVKEDFRNQKN